MGKKGARLTPESEAYVDSLLERLSSVEDLTSRKMFGGFGIFQAGVMFGLVSGTRLHLRVDDSTRARFEAAGATQHRPMPYLSVPPKVEKSRAQFLRWANEAIAVAHRASTKPGKRKRAKS